LAFISEAAQRMRALVQELLNLSRAGNRELKSETVSLESIADHALEALALQVEESGAVITRDPLPEVQGDAVLLTQLYQNLISNALKYTEESPPRIHLDAALQDGKWLLGVRDNGIGINPEYAEQIFQPFKRLHGRGKFEGTGIGLAICRKVVERHHGRIWVESEEGKGAHFRFTLPAKEQET
jgi:signal transduction histidine kinase